MSSIEKRLARPTDGLTEIEMHHSAFGANDANIIDPTRRFNQIIVKNR